MNRTTRAMMAVALFAALLAVSLKAPSVDAARMLKQLDDTNSTNGTNATSALWEYISGAEQFSIATALLEEIGLDEVIKNMDNETVATLFLPTDIAFAFFVLEVGMNVQDIIAKDDGDFLLDVFSYHLVNDVAIANISEASANGGMMFESANGEMITITRGVGDIPIVVDTLGRNTDALGTMVKRDIGNVCLYSSPRVMLPIVANNVEELAMALPGSYSHFATCLSTLVAEDETYSDLLYSNASNVTVLAPLNEAWERYASQMNLNLTTAILENATACQAIVEGAILPDMAYHTLMLEPGMVLDIMYPDETWTVQFFEGRTYTYIYLEGSDAFGVRNPFFLDMDLIAGSTRLHGLDLLTPPYNLGYGNYYGPEYYEDGGPDYGGGDYDYDYDYDYEGDSKRRNHRRLHAAKHKHAAKRKHS